MGEPQTTSLLSGDPHVSHVDSHIESYILIGYHHGAGEIDEPISHR